MKFTIIRFLKTTFIRLRLHVFFSWLNGFLLQLLWMNKLSKWAHAHKKIDFNDFPSKWDYTKRYGLYNYAIEKEGLDSDINYLEFGVANGEFFQGLFQQTLPGFLKAFDNRKKTVLMLDADLYTATLFTLTSFAPYLKEGDIIFFDEFVVPTHEFMAYQQFIDSYYFDLELIGAANNYYFTAFKVKRS